MRIDGEKAIRWLPHTFIGSDLDKGVSGVVVRSGHNLDIF